MVDKFLIHKPPTESLLSEFIHDVIETENFFLEKNSKNNLWYLKSRRENYYNILSIDTNDMVKNFARSLLDFKFDTMLISGLGLGILPFLCQKTTDFIEVVEIESEVIEIVKKLGHLDTNVELINQNIWSFTPKMKYDVILFDHWMSFASENEMKGLKETFAPYLNLDGIITFPIHEQTLR